MTISEAYEALRQAIREETGFEPKIEITFHSRNNEGLKNHFMSSKTASQVSHALGLGDPHISVEQDFFYAMGPGTVMYVIM